MTSEPAEAFVWMWLPGAEEPVIAGRLELADGIVGFNYGRSYLARPDAIPLYLPELPLRPGVIAPLGGLTIAGCIDDAGPDAWGQRVVMQHLLGTGTATGDPAVFGPLTYLLRSGSNRIGALDFQDRSDVYVSRDEMTATLSELMEAADAVGKGQRLSPALDLALLHGSSVGGARPKALLKDDGRNLIAKFSSSTDTYAVVKGEFAAMELAARAGLSAARVELRQVMFARIVFNILTGNSDDHARNHAAFWDGESLTLTPAYDICPQPRAGGETSQSMMIGADGFRMSQLAGCLERASTYMLTESEARELVDHQVEVIKSGWQEVCDLAQMTEVDRSLFWGRQLLNPYAFYGYSAAPV